MVDELTELLELEPLLRKPVRNLSPGEWMKCEIATALLHRPSMFFLDEPTIGLDITMQRHIRSLSDRIAAQRRTPTKTVSAREVNKTQSEK